MWEFYEDAFVWAVAFFSLWSIEYHILEHVHRVGPWVFVHQTQALLLGVITQCCLSPRILLSCELFFGYPCIPYVCFFLIIPFLRKSNFPFMKQYELDVFSKQVLRQFFRSFLKWLSHFNVNQDKSYMYPVFRP